MADPIADAMLTLVIFGGCWGLTVLLVALVMWMLED